MKKKTDRLSKEVFLYSAEMGGSLLISFLSIYTYTRLFSKEQYGVYILLLLVSSFVCGLANIGLSTGFDRYYFSLKSNDEKNGNLLMTTLIIIFISFGIFFSVLLLVASKVSMLLLNDSNYSSLIVLSTLGYFLFYSVTSFYYQQLRNMKKVLVLVCVRLGFQFLLLLFSIFCIIYLDYGLYGIFISEIFLASISITILFIYLNTYRGNYDRSVAIELFKVSMPTTPKIFFSFFGIQFNKIFLARLANLGVVGEYSLAQRMSEMIFTFMTALQNAYIPRIYEQLFSQNDESINKIKNLISSFAFHTYLLSMIIALFSEEIVSLLAPKGYENAAVIARILVIYYSLLLFDKINAVQCIYAKKTSVSTIIAIGSVVLNFTITFYFISFWGALGAAIGSLLTQIIITTIGIKWSGKYVKITYDWKVMSISIIGIVTSALTISLINQFELSLIISLIFKTFILLGFIVVGLRLNVLNIYIPSLKNYMSK